jgi:uncharacterized protein (TIGR03067 family)
VRILLGVSLLVIVAAARAEDKPAGDLGLMQGKWKTMVGPNKDIPVVLEIKGKKAKASFHDAEGKAMSIEGEVLLDEKADPKRLDWVHFTRPNGEEADPNLAIYKFNGDVLTICNGGPNNPRPTEFKNGDNGPPNLIVFEKVKDEESK